MAHRHMNVEIGTVARNSFSGNICCIFSVLILCSVDADIENYEKCSRLIQASKG